MRVLLIHNPGAGYEQADAARLLELIRAAGHEPLYQSSEVDDLGGGLDQPIDLIAVAGGDGTVTRVLKRAVGLATPLAILPLGTANNVAFALGHTGTLEDLMRGWKTAEPRTIDLGLALADWGRARFAESFGVGFIAETMVHTDKGDADKARTRYKSVTDRLNATVKALRKSLGGLKPRPVSFQTPGGSVAGDFLWAEVSTVGMVGPRLPLVDADDFSDGMIAFAALPADERDTFLEYLDHRVAGSAPARTGLVCERVPAVEIAWEGFEAHLDGRLVTSMFESDQRRVRLEALPAAVRVLRLQRPT